MTNELRLFFRKLATWQSVKMGRSIWKRNSSENWSNFEHYDTGFHDWTWLSRNGTEEGFMNDSDMWFLFKLKTSNGTGDICCRIMAYQRGKWFIFKTKTEFGINIDYIGLTLILISTSIPLQWRHNGRNGVSNHHPHVCLLNRLFRCRSKKTSKPRVTGLCVGYSPGTGEFPAQMASNAENVSIWWRRHATAHIYEYIHSTHYNDVIMSAMASQITSITIVFSTVYWDADQRKHQSSASLTFVRGIHR